MSADQSSENARTLSPEAQRLLDARREAIDELRGIDGKERDIRDPNVVRLAAARIFEATTVMRMLAGEPVASSELQNATRMVADARAALPQPPIEVKLVVVHKTYDELVADDPNLYPPRTKQPKQPKLLPPPVIDGEIVTAAPSAVEQASTQATPDVRGPDVAAPANNVRPLPTPPPRRVGSIHDSVLPNSQPARMAPGTSAQLGGFGHVCFGGGVLSESAPNWSASHPLPTKWKTMVSNAGAKALESIWEAGGASWPLPTWEA